MIDLHTHTTCSDGTDSPFSLVKKALAAGITTLAITDHDSTAGWAEAVTAIQPQIELVLGAEVSCLTTDGISVHMLGLLFDGEDIEIQQMLADSRDTRLPRMRKMVELLSADGINISLDDVYRATPEGATVGRPHLADALVANGVVASRDEAFLDLLNNDSKYYVTHAAPTPEDAIRTIRKAGGVAVIAHPFASRRGQTITASTFADLVAAGLNGIEVHHRDQNAQEQETLIAIARELSLVTTGSSDYHGTGKLNGLAENTTHQAQWEQLESLANARRVVKK
ncbi:MAG: PHP domain-containing protein [Candidatus Planktophila sp.]|jgi:predicted metal-dependent phosphoesterase TrpH|nr:PHP domain-containing protein [Candidatus Planktophila sp.]